MVDREEMKYLKELGKRVEKARKSTGTSQGGLADKCKINRMTVIRIEKGDVNSTIGVLRKIARALKMELSELVE